MVGVLSSGLLTVVIVVFVFKQKTADEVGISDWSSDVCASDLDRARGIGQRQASAVEQHERALRAEAAQIGGARADRLARLAAILVDAQVGDILQQFGDGVHRLLLHLRLADGGDGRRGGDAGDARAGDDPTPCGGLTRGLRRSARYWGTPVP